MFTPAKVGLEETLILSDAYKFIFKTIKLLIPYFKLVFWLAIHIAQHILLNPEFIGRSKDLVEKMCNSGVDEMV